MRARITAFPILLCATLAATGLSEAADYSCNGLVAIGKKMICSGFEPNWAVELLCSGGAMTSNFIDAFSGDGIKTTPGSVTFTSENPWTLTTSHGIAGSIASTPGSCEDEGNNIHDFTFTPTAAPGLSGPFHPFCCRIQ